MAVPASGLVPAARAQDDAALARARERFVQGEAYFKAGLWEKAIAEYRAAYELVPRPGLLFNMGLCYENLGNPARAVDFYGQYLRAEPTGRKAPEARARRDALVERIVADQGKSEREAQGQRALSEGRAALERGDYDEALERLAVAERTLDDPAVTFFVAEAYRGKGDRILAAAGYRRYLDTAPSGEHRERASEGLRELERTGAEERPTASPVPPIGEPADEPVTRRGSFVPAIIALSVAGVAGAVGIGFGVSARSTLDELDDQLVTGNPPLDTGDGRFDDGKSAASAARLSFAVAGVAAATGAVLAALAWRRRPVEAGAARVVPTAAPGGVAVGVEVVW